MTPSNGRYMFISHATLSASDTLVPVGTTHCVFGSAAAADVYGVLGVELDGTNLNKLLVPLGEFIRIGSIFGGTTNMRTEGTAPASSVTSVTFYRWELEAKQVLEKV